MRNYKKVFSYFFYTLSIVSTLGVGFFVIYVSRKYVFANEGIGVYGVLIYYAAAFCSVIFWGISCYLFQNRKLTVVYWLLFLAITIFIATQPTWWAAP